MADYSVMNHLNQFFGFKLAGLTRIKTKHVSDWTDCPIIIGKTRSRGAHVQIWDWTVIPGKLTNEVLFLNSYSLLAPVLDSSRIDHGQSSRSHYFQSIIFYGSFELPAVGKIE